MRRSKKFVVLLAALTIAVLAVPAFAGYTTVQYAGEPNHTQIFDNVYGGIFTGSGTDLGYGMWTQFSNGPITAHRINDLNGEEFSLNIISNGPDDVDQIWTNGVTQVTAEAKYAAFNQSFGWNGGGLGTNYIELLTHNDVGNGAVEFSLNGDFLWGMQPNSDEWWSLNSLNSDDADHMVTYKITGLETDWTVWAVFHEDLPYASSDFDYNDFVVEVRAVPEPASMLLLGLGALALLRKRRN